MICAHALTRMYGPHRAVDAIDFEVGRGDVVGFLGPNGAGKSTTLRMLSGYLPPTSGTAEVNGIDVRTNSRGVRGSIGYLPESTPLYGEMRVVEYLRFRARLFSIPRRERASAIDRVVERCWLQDVARKPIGHLSKGYRQRVGLAAALLHNPPVLLLDEPTSGLDPSQIREVRRLVRDLAGDHTVLLSTHILPEVEVTCDRIIIIARGRVRAAGRIDDIRRTAAQRISYIVEVKSEGVSRAVRELPGVQSVEVRMLDDGWTRLTIGSSDDAADLREPISSVLAGNAVPLRELRRETPTLEQVFIRLTADAAAPGEAEHAPAGRTGAAT